jgi:plastocyanin
MIRRRGWIFCLLVAVAGCGGDDDGDKPEAEGPTTQRAAASAPTSRILFVADPKIPLRFTRKTYRTEPGRVELRLENPSQAVHNVAVEQSAKCCRQPGNRQFGLTTTISPGETTRAVVELPPGRYWAYCGVEGHWQGGMVSRLIVK